MKQPTDYAIDIIQNAYLRNNSIGKIKIFRKRGEFEAGNQWLYARWAAKELISELDNNRSIPPLLIIGQFTERMDEYSTHDHPCAIAFSVASDVGKHIESLLS